MIRTITLLLLTTISTSLFSQSISVNQSKDYSAYPYWIEMMQDESVNFYDVQEAFNVYWEGREITKGNGWKQFKRWEWRMEHYINPDGSRVAPDKVYKEYMKYLENNPKAKDSNGDWTNLGPVSVPSKGYEGLGRINAIAFHPTDPDIVYIGAPAGGLWKYDGSFGGWTSTTDNQPTLGVSSIIINWENPDIIYMGTGDRDAGDAAGLGVFRSTDGGGTWEVWNNGMGNRTVGRLIQHPGNAAIIYAATSGGLYKTTNAGADWVFKHNGGTKEVVFKPGDPTILYAGGNGKFYKSSDDGENWIQITNGIPNGNRSVIAVTEDDPEYVYCLLSTGDSYKGIYRSTNSGESFTEMSTSPNIMSWGCNGGSGGQAWYDLDVAVDPNNKNVIFAGGVNCFKSTDGGTTWDISSHWWGDCSVPAVHADLHVLEYNPLNDRLYAGNDGGIYYTMNGGSTWPEITDGLPISQVYRIGQSKTNIDKVINGYQDNGTSTYYGNDNWQTSYGGDGMECAFDHEDEAYSYATVYYGDIYRLYNNGSSHRVGGDGAHGMNESGGWITPYCLHEGNSNIMFGGYQNIWRAEGVKSNNFTWDKLTTSGGGNIDVVEHSPADFDLFFYARNGQLYRSDDIMEDAPVWTTLTTYLPGGGDVYDVECHPFDAEVVYITQGSGVYVSNDRGFTWTEISGTLPNINMNSLAAYVNSVDGIYVGSDAGVYYRDASMSDWTMFSNGLPIDASVNEIEIYHNPDNPEDDVIRVGTYGRGLWSSPVWHGEPLADFEASETSVPVGCEVNFTDLSQGVPTSWAWSFEGATPSSSTEKNPQGIIYLNQGTFDVTLTVSNSEGNDTKTINGYMNVSETTVPDVYFVASDSITCSGVEISFTDMSSNCPTGWSWSFDPWNVTYVNGTSSTSQNPVVVFNESTAYDVTLTVTNSAGNNSLEKTAYIQIGGIQIPFEDDFESGGLTAKSWSVVNPDFNKTWETATVGGNGPGDQAAYMNFFEYIVPPGSRDQLISPVLNFGGFDNAYLSFKHAYAKQHSSVTDSLIVKVSDDCGSSWTRIFEGGEDNNGVFATHELMTDPFVPAEESDWCGAGWGAACIVLDLSPWAGNSNIQVMFETYNYFGNNLYIDDVIIQPLTGISNSLSSDKVMVFPNPTTGLVNFVIPENDGSAEVFIYNNQGVEVERINGFENNTVSADLSAYSAGVYFVRIIERNGITVLKLVLE
ncbi:MAG: PKD domain-containing protein [Bacteroidales bacterium]|nr:PKD domain-containing protein [Bacteroidales bacterium]MCF8402366.1 PKD domain-containing protein [Bacteroidales bacterium]